MNSLKSSSSDGGKSFLDAAVEGLNQIDKPGTSLKKLNESFIEAAKILAASVNRLGDSIVIFGAQAKRYMMFFSYAALVGAILFGSAQIIRSVGYTWSKINSAKHARNKTKIVEIQEQ
jgi:hypothetical protein